ncbi:hypothetical protein M404DRAFT_521871 [Pisolithus tinctorius Marx 270]|uniref:Uncharacterized protein n=1 Tax=Pisolithus tinctorius Marx 270 TaxID=870435 RepID=A0A0C3PBL2_PISTI|nr:hypothetical protein M404DRAFT_521871 [Pisolithus tinctorius Marx 270]
MLLVPSAAAAIVSQHLNYSAACKTTIDSKCASNTCDLLVVMDMNIGSRGRNQIPKSPDVCDSSSHLSCMCVVPSQLTIPYCTYDIIHGTSFIVYFAQTSDEYYLLCANVLIDTTKLMLWGCPRAISSNCLINTCVVSAVVEPLPRDVLAMVMRIDSRIGE